MTVENDFKGVNFHKQVEIEVSENGKKKTIECDEGVAPLIKEIHEAGFATNFSCQGDENHIAYVVIRNPRHRNLAIVDNIVRKFWSGKLIRIKISQKGHLCYYGFTDLQFLRDFISYPTRNAEWL